MDQNLIQIPGAYREKIETMYGAACKDWLNGLPAMLKEYGQLWGVRILPPFSLSYNYVAPVLLSSGGDAVLKVGLPFDPELKSEIHALRVYAGEGAARLIESNLEDGIFLMERVQPGKELVDLKDDEQATRIAARVMRALWKPVPPGTDHLHPSTAAWGKGFQKLRAAFNGGTGPFESCLVEKAERLFRDLLANQKQPVLLHGDLHHWNILSSDRAGWLAVDPKGVIGEAEYEPGALLRNPIPEVAYWTDLITIQDRRVRILCEELGFDRKRVICWAFAQVILAAWWSYEETSTVWQPWIKIAESFQRIE